MNDNPIVGDGTSLQAWNTSKKLAQLPVISVDMLVPINSRAVIIAPHPDDEVLGCGGLMRQLAQLERPLKLISVTDGSASHPGSDAWPAERRSLASSGFTHAQLAMDTRRVQRHRRGGS